MLSFLRNNAIYIGWGIVILFVGTMFTGTVFLGLQGKSSSEKPQDLTGQIAVVGNTPVDKRKYAEVLNSLYNQYRSAGKSASLSPNVVESLQFVAFQQALQYTLLLKGAEAQRINVSGAELDGAIDTILKQYKLKDKGALKDLLKQNQYPYDEFEQGIRNEIMVRKFSGGLQSSVTVSERDVENKYSEVNIQHLLVMPKVSTTNNQDEQKKYDEEAQKKVLDIQKQIQNGLSFDEAAKTSSDDLATRPNGGQLGWVGVGKMVPEFEAVAFVLDQDEVSQPVRTAYGYHLIKLLDRREKRRPINLDIEKEKAAILKDKQQRALQSYFSTILNTSKIQILDPSLEAFKAKSEGDFATAFGAYQSLVSQNPTNPLPHYYIAKLYEQLGNLKNAKLELQKASIKGELNKSMDLPIIHIELAGLYQRDGNLSEAQKEYDKALTLSDADMTSLETLLGIFKKRGDAGKVRATRAKITTLKLKLAPSATPTTTAPPAAR